MAWPSTNANTGRYGCAADRAGGGQAVDQLQLLPVDAQVGLGRADRVGRQRDAVKDQVREVRQEQPVLGAGRLSLRAVGDHNRLAAPGDGTHLAPGWEAGATSAGEAGRLHHVDQALGPPLAGPAAQP